MTSGRRARTVVVVVVPLCLLGVLIAILAGVAHVNLVPTSAGDFRWSSAVVASRTARTLTVQADVEGQDARIGCTPLVQSHVTETGSAVRVRVEVLNLPLPPGTACAASALVSLPATVHLAAPLGTRRLVEGTTGSAHPVLVVNEQPTLRGVPAPFARRATSWDEDRRTVSEWWRWQRHGQAAQIDLDFGPDGGLPSLIQRAQDATHPRIGSAVADVWREQGSGTVVTTVVWSPEPGRTVQLRVLDQSFAPLGVDDVLTLARSVR